MILIHTVNLPLLSDNIDNGELYHPSNIQLGVKIKTFRNIWIKAKKFKKKKTQIKILEVFKSKLKKNNSLKTKIKIH